MFAALLPRRWLKGYSFAALYSTAIAILFCVVPAQSQSDRLSPRGLAEAMISGKMIRITYGRPYRKGRRIFGSLVPYGKPWRTGADEATSLATNGTLMIGNLLVPPGAYSLLTIPAENSTWKLIINRDLNLLGANQYNRKHDLGRVDMAVSAAAQMEQLTISIEQTGDTTGTLRIGWENIVASVPISVTAGG